MHHPARDDTNPAHADADRAIFCINMMDCFKFKTMNCALKTRNCASKTRNCAFQMIDFAGQRRVADRAGPGNVPRRRGKLPEGPAQAR